jgi:hypothetical protein
MLVAIMKAFSSSQVSLYSFGLLYHMNLLVYLVLTFSHHLNLRFRISEY